MVEIDCTCKGENLEPLDANPCIVQSIVPTRLLRLVYGATALRTLCSLDLPAAVDWTYIFFRSVAILNNTLLTLNFGEGF